MEMYVILKAPGLLALIYLRFDDIFIFSELCVLTWKPLGDNIIGMEIITKYIKKLKWPDIIMF